ncbi:MAG: hypothetical protein ABJP34_00075 [Erythrobacter sp.]
MYDLGVVVPARRGSSRIKEKCLLPFGDSETLIEWKLAQLCKVIEPHRIYLSSEDDAFLDLAKNMGVSRHQRDPQLAVDHIAPFRDVITGIVRDIPHEHIAWATVVCPLMAPSEYLTAFGAYHSDVIRGQYDSLIGVDPVQDYYWSAAGPINYEASRNHTISQELPKWFKVTNSLYMAPRALMLEREYFIGKNPLLQRLSKLAAVDIDYIEDYRIACALYSVYREYGLDAVEAGTKFESGGDQITRQIRL